MLKCHISGSPAPPHPLDAATLWLAHRLCSRISYRAPRCYPGEDIANTEVLRKHFKVPDDEVIKILRAKFGAKYLGTIKL